MKTISDPEEMMCGAYILEMADREEADRIISKFAGCPNWPVVTRGPKENEVFILAVELKRQCHGDFSEGNNSLVKSPQIIGAQGIRFVRIHSSRQLLGQYHHKTGYSADAPCGTDCNTCPMFRSPCRGCPAVFEM